ncbi:MAG: histone H1 [bacterium]|nr:histone H1 [bacterium]
MNAFRVVQEATEEKEPEIEEPKTSEEKNPHAVALGRLGGKKGGKARAAKLTPEHRSEIARKAAQKRWSTKT